MTATATPTVRQSFAARFDLCPQSGLFDEQVPEHSTHAQARGTIFHGFVVRLIEELTERDQPVADPDRAKEIMAEEIVRSGLAVPADEFDVLMGLAWKFTAERRFDLANIVDLEETYTSEIDGTLITGRPDRLDISEGVASMWDYKTGWAIDPESELEGTFQGRFYTKLIADAYPQVHTFRLLWDYPRWGAEPHEAVITRDKLRGVELYLTTLIRRIRAARERDEWPASGGSWCHTCAAKPRCPIPPEYCGEGAIDTPARAQAAGEFLVPIDAIRKSELKALRSWCGENGPVTVGDLVFDFRLKAGSDRVIDREALKAAMQAAGMEYETYFKHVKGSTEFKARKAEKVPS